MVPRSKDNVPLPPCSKALLLSQASVALVGAVVLVEVVTAVAVPAAFGTLHVDRSTAVPEHKAVGATKSAGLVASGSRSPSCANPMKAFSLLDGPDSAYPGMFTSSS